MISWNFYCKRRQKWDKTDTWRQNTASLEQKFTAHLKVLSHHWRWWRWHLECLALDCPALKKPCRLSLKVAVHVTYICVGVLSHPQSSWWGEIKSSNLRLYHKTKTKWETFLLNERGRQILSFSVLGGWQLVWKILIYVFHPLVSKCWVMETSFVMMMKMMAPSGPLHLGGTSPSLEVWGTSPW